MSFALVEASLGRHPDASGISNAARWQLSMATGHTVCSPGLVQRLLSLPLERPFLRDSKQFLELRKGSKNETLFPLKTNITMLPRNQIKF